MVSPRGDCLSAITVAVAVALIPVIIPVPSVPIPAMIVLVLALVAGPISVIKLFPIVAGAYPSGAFIGRPGVVSGVPNITIVGRIPITVHP